MKTAALKLTVKTKYALEHTHLQLDLESQKRISETLANSIIYFTIQLFLSRVLLGQCHRELVQRRMLVPWGISLHSANYTHTLHAHALSPHSKSSRLSTWECEGKNKAAKVNSLCAGDESSFFKALDLPTLFLYFGNVIIQHCLWRNSLPVFSASPLP